MDFLRQALLGRNRHWLWYAFACVVIFVAFLFGQLPLMGVIQYRISSGTLSEGRASEFYETADFALLGIPASFGLFLLLMSFCLALAALFIVIRHLHGRPVRSLISPGSVSWRKILISFAFWICLTAVAELVMYLIDPDAYQFIFNWQAWFPLMLVVIFILPLQTTFEEVFVRGYLMQRVATGLNRPWLAVVITSVFFGIMHLGNPEIAEFGMVTMMVYYISVGAALAIVTVLDDGLEYALGIHAATNIYGAGFVTYAGSALQTDALVRVQEVNALLMIVFFYVSIALFFVYLHLQKGGLDWKRLFTPVVAIPPAEGGTESADARNIFQSHQDIL